MSRRFIALSVSVLALAIGVGPASATEHEAADPAKPEPKAWDQVQVAALAEELQHAVDGLRDSARSQPPDSIASGQARAREEYMDKLRSIEDECRSLKGQAADGKGRDETLHTFLRIDELRRDAAEEARRMFLPKDTLDKIEAARAVLEKLRLYYSGVPDNRPGLVGPKAD